MADRLPASEPQRQQFGNTLEKYATLFTLCCNSYYVRAFWVYSYQHSILAWLIAYAVMQLIVGIPMFLMEYFVGQLSSSSVISMYSVTPALKGTGITSLFLIMMWICISIHDTGKELVTLAYTFTMPWTHCGNWWNTEQCQMKSNPSGNYSYDDSYNYEMRESFENPSEEFFKYVLNGMNIGFLWYVMLASIIVFIAVYFLAVEGTRIMGKVALVSTVFHMGTTVVLLLVGLAITFTFGGTTGFAYYFYPSMYKLLEANLWMDASKVILLHQQMGHGIIATIGSYDKVRNNCLVDAIIVAIFNFMFPFINGIVSIAFFGFLSEKIDTDMNDVAYSSGSMSWALSLVPGHFLWVFLYVLMIFTGKLVYLVISLEVVITSLSDAYPEHFKNRKKIALGVCVPLMLFSIIFCIGNYHGYLLFNYVDYYILGMGFMANLSWFIFIFAYLYGAGRLVRDIRHFLPGISWVVTWPCYLSWIIIIHIAYAAEHVRISGIDYNPLHGHYPYWTGQLGQFFASIFMWFTIIYAIIYLIKTKGTFLQRLKSGFLPSADWGPKELSTKQAWEEYSKRRPMCCGCSHPDCCTTHYSSAVDDVAIPIRVEMTATGYPLQPSSSPDETYPMTNKPGPGSTVEDGLYPNLPAAS